MIISSASGIQLLSILKKGFSKFRLISFFSSSFPFDDHECELTFGSDAVSNSYGFDLLKPIISYKAVIFYNDFVQ